MTLSKLSSQSNPGGTVAGAGGVGGSVGTSVGLTTTTQNANKVKYYTVMRIFMHNFKIQVAFVILILFAELNLQIVLHVLSLMLTPGPSRLGVWVKTVAL